MILPGFGPRPCSYEVMAAAGCPRRRPTGLSQVVPSLEDDWCMGQAAAARNIASKRALLEHSLRKNRALLRDFIISVGVSTPNATFWPWGVDAHERAFKA